MNKIFYIARFNPSEFGDTKASNINYSVIRKVLGTCAALTLNKKQCYIIRTSTARGDIFVKATARKYGKNIVITPRLFDLKIRFLNYFLNIIISTFLTLSLSKRCKPKEIIFWDLLPDTSIPAIISSLFNPKIRIIPDIEEFIASDDLAPKFFKWYERILLTIRWGVVLTAGMPLNNKVKFIENIELKGYFAESLNEERWCIEQLSNLTRQENSSVTTLIFTGRIDSMRGFPEFLELAKLMNGERYKFKAFGFGESKTLSMYERLSEGFVETFFHANRKKVLLSIMKSNYCFNYISNVKFSRSSFPSKLIEYYCLGKCIVSNHDVNDIEIKPYIFKNLYELKEYIDSRSNFDQGIDFKRKLHSFSIIQAASRLESL